MTVTPRGGSIAPSMLGIAHAGPLDTARRRRRVSLRLERLREAFAEHVSVTEGATGLYAEVLVAAPRLARTVGVLVREHSMITRTLDALTERLVGVPVDAERFRNWASDLLRELSRHRQRGADLVYEAYATDIGGET